MNDNRSAFSSKEYDDQIKRTLPFHDEFYRQIIDAVRSCPPKPLHWLDVGCGTGGMARAAYKELEIERFVFCDSSPAMIELVQNRFSFPNAGFLVSAVQELDFHDVFDVVTAVQVHHYLKGAERKKALENCRNALKPGGIFFCFDNFAPFSGLGKTLFLDRWKAYQLRQGKSMEECGRHAARYQTEYFPITLPEQLELLRGCGFQAVEPLWLSYMQAGFLAVK